MILLSILICTIPERKERFDKLLNELMRQKEIFDTYHNTIGRVEILANKDKRFLDGGLSIGKKRQALVQDAEGKYLCFLDDDEDISPDYLETLMRLCNMDADVVTFRAMVKLSNFWALVDMQLVHKFNDQASPDYTVRRCAWHMCPIKSVYAKMFQFADINNAEDYIWMEQVTACCSTEAHTNRILYQYNHGEHSEADKIPLP